VEGPQEMFLGERVEARVEAKAAGHYPSGPSFSGVFGEGN